MVINDFSALIQLFATISIAFVAVEYVRSFTGVLCERLFDFKDFVKKEFKNCREILTDRETLDHLQPCNIDGNSTVSAIEEAKRKNESLRKEIDQQEKNMNDEVANACQARSMSSLCFFLFLINSLLLFWGGIEKEFQDFSHTFLIFFCSLSIVYLITGWLLGEKENPRRFRDFSSLKHVGCSFIIICLLSFILPWAINKWLYTWFVTYIQPLWWCLMVVLIVLSYVNFCVFIAKIWQKAQSFKKKVTSSANNLKEQAKAAEKEVEELKTTNRLSARLQTD